MLDKFGTMRRYNINFSRHSKKTEEIPKGIIGQDELQMRKKKLRDNLPPKPWGKKPGKKKPKFKL